MNNKLSLLVNFVGVDKMSGALRNIVGLGNRGSTSLRALAGDSRKLTRDLRGVQRELARGSGNVTELVNRERQLEQQLARTNGQIDRQQRLAGINADRMAMLRRASELKSKGQENVLGGIAMAAPLIYATKAAADFSSGMVDIQQKADLSNRETDAMANNIIRLAAAARQLPEDMRAGVDVLSGFGLDPRKAAMMIAPIGRLGTAFKVDLSDGAAAAYANLNNLKVPINQTAAALDVMAAAGNAGAFEVKDMARWFPSLTAQAQALGQKGVGAVADLSAALQIARRGAGDANAAANNVQNLLGKINSPATIRAFQKNFGVDLPNALKKAYAQGKTPLEAIAEITKKATGGDMSKLGFAFEDMQAQGALRSLIQDLDDYRKMRDSIANSSGTVDKAFNQRTVQDATVKWRAMMGQLQATALVLGAKLLPVAAQFMDTASGIAMAVANWAQAHPQLASYLAQGAAALISFKIGLGVTQYALGSILGPFATVLSFFRKVDGISKFGALMVRLGPMVGSAASGLARGFGLMRSAGMLLAQGLARAGAMMLANPIILIIAAIAVAVGVAAYLIYTHWDKIKATFWGAVDAVKQTLQGLPGWLRNIGSMMMQGLLLAINPMALAGKLLEVARNGITAFKNYFGIKSPSRLFMQMGGHLTDGLAIGIDRNRHAPSRAIGRMATGVMAAGSMSLTPMAAAARPGTAGPGAASGDRYEIHIHQQPGEDADALVRRIMAEIDKARARKSRSGYGDDR